MFVIEIGSIQRFLEIRSALIDSTERLAESTSFIVTRPVLLRFIVWVTRKTVELLCVHASVLHLCGAVGGFDVDAGVQPARPGVFVNLACAIQRRRFLLQ